MELSRYEDYLEYLPEKEREAVKDLRIEENEVENVAMSIIRWINTLKPNGIKGLGGRNRDDGY